MAGGDVKLLMVALLLSGIIAYRYRLMPLSALPGADYPTIQIVTLYPGAGPDVMTSSVTAPLETQFGQMPGLNQMSSTSSGGASVITLQFALTLSLDVAEQEVQAAINAATTFLPTDLPMPPIYNKVNPADATDCDARHHLENHAAAEARRSGRYTPRAKIITVARHRLGQHQRRPAPRRAYPR